MKKINFSSDKEEIVVATFDNNYGVEILPNFELYVRQDIQGQNQIYRYDLGIYGFNEEEDTWYSLFGVNMIDPHRLYNLSQEQVEDICEEISLLPQYLPHSDVADYHAPVNQLGHIVNEAVDKALNEIEKGQDFKIFEMMDRIMRFEEDYEDDYEEDYEEDDDYL